MPSENGDRPTARAFTTTFTVKHYAQDVAEAREQGDEMGKALFDRPETDSVASGPVRAGGDEPHPLDYDS